ncbi:MAG: hypothetical protein ACPGQS_07785 [Bradymonadia bacterium]
MSTLVLVVAVSNDRPQGKILGRGTQENYRHLKAFHRLCQKYAIMPTYLLSYPALRSDSLDWLYEAESRGECECGTLFQSWTTPPFEASENRLATTPTDRQPRHVVHQKFVSLRTAFFNRFGRFPRSNQTEGWDYSTNLLQALTTLGYDFDCSFAPGESVNHSTGSIVPTTPFYPSIQNPTLRGDLALLELPVLTNTPSTEAVLRYLPKGRGIRHAFESVTSACGFAQTVVDPFRQSVSQVTLAVEQAIELGRDPIVLTLKSFDIGVGTSDLATSDAELSDLLSDLDRVLCELVDTMRIPTFGLEYCGDRFSNRILD